MFAQKLKKLKEISDREKRAIYVVGGCLRDLMLGMVPTDIDLAVSGDDVLSFTKRLSESIDAVFVPLDPVNQVARLILSCGENKLQLDTAALKGSGIIEDLHSRDFTINAMAVPLAYYISGNIEENIIDPTGGLSALQDGRIRAAGTLAFTEDPVRVLRAFRLSGKLNFTIEKDTLDLMKNARRPLSAASPERVLEELMQIFALPYSFRVVDVMDKEMDLFCEIFSRVQQMRASKQNNYRTENVWEHSLSTLRILEKDILPGLPDNLKENINLYLNEPLAAGRSRLPALKLACLLHDVGKIETAGVQSDGRITFYGHEKAGIKFIRELASDLKMGIREQAVLEALVKRHMYPLHLYINRDHISGAAVYRFFKAAGREAPGCLLLSIADAAASRCSMGKAAEAEEYKEFIYSLFEKYFYASQKYVDPPRLITGKDLMELFSLHPSRLIGDILEKILEAQVDGTVRNKDEAIMFASKILGFGPKEAFTCRVRMS